MYKNVKLYLFLNSHYKMYKPKSFLKIGGQWITSAQTRIDCFKRMWLRTWEDSASSRSMKVSVWFLSVNSSTQCFFFCDLALGENMARYGRLLRIRTSGCSSSLMYPVERKSNEHYLNASMQSYAAILRLRYTCKEQQMTAIAVLLKR